MAHEIIDLTRYLEQGRASEPAAGTMALWGADGERSRFALPLWRVVQLAEADRGVILWRDDSDGRVPHPFVVLDLASEPARLEVSAEALEPCVEREGPELFDLGSRGLIVHLGARAGRSWFILVDGGDARETTLEARKREDVLFLAGECAGLLFFRDFADQGVEHPTE